VYSDVVEFGVALTPLATSTKSITVSPVVIDANQIEMTVWFLSDLGETQICPITITEDF